MIPDVKILSVAWQQGRLLVLSEHDHLLRRFGQLEVRRLEGGQVTTPAMRTAADELWCALEGQVEVALLDKRAGSPSEDQSMHLALAGDSPQALLVPFGVEYVFTAQGKSLLLRLTTHAELS